jgi:hypothetical protein
MPVQTLDSIVDFCEPMTGPPQTIRGVVGGQTNAHGATSPGSLSHLQISSSLAPLIDKFREKLKGYDVIKIPRLIMFSKDSVVKNPYPELDIIERDGRVWIVHNTSNNIKQY